MTNYRILDIKYLIFKKIWLKIKGRLQGNGIDVFYVKWSNNFGDLLTPIILKHYGFTPVYAYPHKAKATVVGTILEIVGNSFPGYILGSGWSRDVDVHFPNTKIRGVRGLLTKKNLQANENTTIGDPGLLISQIMPYARNIKYKIGIIPHESEIEDKRLNELKKRGGKDILIINPRRNKAAKVLEEIVSCQYIVSSSLHGLIVSDSYNIPNGRIKLNDLDQTNDYKFNDYYSSINEALHTLDITGDETLVELVNTCRTPPREIIEKRKVELNLMFQTFAKEIRK